MTLHLSFGFDFIHFHSISFNVFRHFVSSIHLLYYNIHALRILFNILPPLCRRLSRESQKKKKKRRRKKKKKKKKKKKEKKKKQRRSK